MKWVRGAQIPPERDPQLLGEIVDELFPTHPPMEWPEPADELIEAGPPITEEELLRIAASLNPHKAPGPDGIPNAAVTAAVRAFPGVYRRVLQGCLDRGVFPDIWKHQRLVLLSKPGKPPGRPSSYRPLCMLDTVGKVLERIILDRLNAHLEEDPEGPRLSPRQFGFRKGRSTMQAIEEVVARGREAMAFGRTNARDRRCCMVVTLDVRNAFNSASWTEIGAALREKRTPEFLMQILRSYFEGRVLHYSTEAGTSSRNITAGVPQGSILGPTLWNVMYDGVLDVELPEGASIVGFADDLVLTVAGRTPEEAAEGASAAIIAVQQWLDRHSLSLALDKTEISFRTLGPPGATSSRALGGPDGWVNFHLTQVITGHGFFREYLFVKGFTQSPDCPNCPGTVESAEHAVFHCPRFDNVRGRLLRGHGMEPATPDNLQLYMLHSADSWSRVVTAASEITRQLQSDWRAEQHRRSTAAAEATRAQAAEAAARRARNQARRRRPELTRRLAALTPAARSEWSRVLRNIQLRIRRLRNRTTRRANHEILERRNEALLREHEAVTEEELLAARRDLTAADAALQEARRLQRRRRR
ncbi:uncharacterized protein LOC131292350 [Anopheles ziemanni]|uniref:uncharacterized protein LOC131270701 n=1 Tax=Anopheles coustani TaxID=139045 RepID=UPI00265B7138|nr:uncharacterized protein LOC131270701 [Anopheles coustani]XP_058176788.1 uncharacterized protein LOC131292350 [Anopheles ziemanni]